MPLIRCQKCGVGYDVPASMAVRLPRSIATCECGAPLLGNKAALLSRFFESGNIEELDLQRFRVDDHASATAPDERDDDPGRSHPPLHLRVIARAEDDSINTVYSIGEQPLWIGRKGCHIEFDDPDLDLRHCAIERRRGQLVVRDLDSHTGTFLDGEAVTEAVVGEGVHILRIGSALICIEPTSEAGVPIGPMQSEKETLEEQSPLTKRLLEQRAAKAKEESPLARRAVLRCVEGPLAGQSYEIPDTGLTVGREGDVQVPDEYLSRKHFFVGRDEEGELRVRDMGSRNGTFLNTLPARDTKIRPGDQIRAGLHTFRVEELG